MKMKAGVLGPRRQMAAFHALGLDTVFAEDGQTARQAFSRMVREEYGLIYLSEDLLPFLEEQVEQCSARPLPAVILLPGAEGGTSAASDQLRAAVLRAVGADIA